jgi:hypothetical protein
MFLYIYVHLSQDKMFDRSACFVLEKPVNIAFLAYKTRPAFFLLLVRKNPTFSCFWGIFSCFSALASGYPGHNNHFSSVSDQTIITTI